MARILVTGIEGFVGGHLAPYFTGKGAEVIGTAFDMAAARKLGVPVRPLNITEGEAMKSIIKHERPTHVVHLAAISSVRQSSQEPTLTQDVNLKGTANLLEACAALPEKPRVLLIGSSEEYGLNDGTPLKEYPLSALKPVSPYGESKKAVEELVEKNPVYLSMCVRTRSFQHIGPGQAPGFVVSDWVHQIARSERAEQEPVLKVGNLSPKRDFTDVRDVVRAYWLLLTEGKTGEVYNVCSGKPILLRELANKLAGLSKVKMQIVQEPSRMRAVDIPVLWGSNEKILRDVSWRPEIPLEKTLADALEFVRAVNEKRPEGRFAAVRRRAS